MQEVQSLPLIIAHRGASALAPENTVAAFEQAIQAGADGIEFDVQLSKDGVPIIFHDFTLQRMMKRKERTSSFTLAELQTLDIGAWFNNFHTARANAKFIGEAIPTLKRLFDFLSGYSGRLYVELKCEADDTLPLVEAVIKEIRQRDLLPNIVLKSFNLKAVEQAKKILPEICSAALFAPKLGSLLHKNDYLIAEALRFRADELSLHYSLATPKLLAGAAEKNLPVTIWTADNPVWIKRSLRRGIRAIITNDPARLLAKRRKFLQPDVS